MPRSIWTGAISFGLVSIPVKLIPATESKSLHFHQFHAKDHARIHNERVCAKGHRDIEYEDIAWGYEYEKGRHVVLTDEERDAAKVKSTKMVDITAFVDLAEIDPVYFDKSYYSVPDQGGAKAYRLMVRALGEEKKVAIGKVALRDRERLAAIRADDGMLVMEVMHWPDEVRSRDFSELDETPRTSAKELQMARSLIDSLSDSFDPAAYSDEYREALDKLVEDKVKGREVEVVEEEEPEAVADLMDALRRSVESVQERRAPKRKKAS